MATHGHFVLNELKNGAKTVQKLWKRCEKDVKKMWKRCGRIVEVVNKHSSYPDG
ncbi:hypothetical protein KAR91_17780 [Candidatus Pacearchaeota archaeon]|nr:hypothetical protein [Candidatus Pacearchaeota archaeon]